MTLQELQKQFPNATAQTWHQHPNGCGWVQNTAKVEASAYIGENARVSGTAQVSGDAQVYGTAQVSGDARVSGTAWVSGTAQVYGNARVYGTAQVSGDAWVSGNAWVFGDAWTYSPLYIQGTKNALTVCAYGMVAIGCQVHSIKDWKKHGRRIALENGYSKAEVREYAAYVKLAESWMRDKGVLRVTKAKKSK